MTTQKVKIGLLQLNPKIGQLPQNIAKATNILSGAFPSLILPPSNSDQEFKPINANGLQEQPDIIILPELALTGYNFSSPQQLEPYLEPTSSGPSTQWAKDVSLKLGCHTVIGYPEKCVKTQKHYNSAVMVDPRGNVLFNYRKTHLYYSDETSGFLENPDRDFSKSAYGPWKSLCNGNIKLNVGICMDLNPYKFEAPFEKYEFANSCKANGANLILCPMAWTSSKSPSLIKTEGKEFEALDDQRKKDIIDHKQSLLLEARSMYDKSGDPIATNVDLLRKPEFSTLNYWLQRMSPYVNEPNQPRSNISRVGFVAGNRIGYEQGDVLYAGSSSVFVFNGKPISAETNPSESVEYYGSLGKAEEGFMMVQIEVDKI
ncbi:carbon-nitrogen hydrolase [Nadsonia fulvescens var. elongata DSM 6958]|uniref:Carbon-nitrogen hydrolase n=1 Tax=Nadsonia fulvescens var. elongata DSM 6958 TaxID=857566 RepID=A0A1E3PDY5_9ASCO|nr:carbon-nitrogen hydrolase [Nadsonia fulvescens var. elongata DSM 6958]